jgi:hypothetical protein
MINLRYDVLRLCYHVDSADSEGWARVHIGFGVWASGHPDTDCGTGAPGLSGLARSIKEILPTTVTRDCGLMRPCH